MAAKKDAEVIIGGKVYTLSGYEEEEYLQKVATYINSKITELNELSDAKLFSADTRALLLELNIADDYFKAKSQIERFEEDLNHKDKELYDLKHDLVSYQVKAEELEAKVRQLETDKQELLNTKSKLEASLEDALLGSLS